MRITKTLVAAAAIAVAGSGAFAGGLAPAAPTPPVSIPLPPPETGPVSSVPAGYIVLGLLAALVAASGSF